MRSSTGSEGAGSGVWGRAGRESLGRELLSWVWQKPREFRTPAFGRGWSYSPLTFFWIDGYLPLAEMKKAFVR